MPRELEGPYSGRKEEFDDGRIQTSSAAFSPSDLSGLRRWYKGDGQTGLNDGDPITTLVDSAGIVNGSAAGTAKPLYKTNIANGKPVFRFDGIDDFFSIGDLSAFPAGELFLVVKAAADPQAVSSNAGSWNFSASDSESYFPFTDGSIYEAFGSTVRKTVGNPAASLAVFNIYNIWSAPNDWAAYLNDTLLFATATNTVNFRAAAEIGRSQNTTVLFTGDIAEVILCNTKQSAGLRASAKAHLKAKYATP